MKIKTRLGEIELKLYGFAAEKMYEDRNKKALNLNDATVTTIIELFYCITMANLKRNKKDIIPFDDWFDDMYDLNDGDITFTLFYKWYIEQKVAESELLPKVIEEQDKKKKE